MPVAFHPPSLPTPEGARPKPAAQAEAADNDGDPFGSMLAAASGTPGAKADPASTATDPDKPAATGDTSATDALLALLAPYGVPAPTVAADGRMAPRTTDAAADVLTGKAKTPRAIAPALSSPTTAEPAAGSAREALGTPASAPTIAFPQAAATPAAAPDAARPGSAREALRALQEKAAFLPGEAPATTTAARDAVPTAIASALAARTETLEPARHPSSGKTGEAAATAWTAATPNAAPTPAPATVIAIATAVGAPGWRDEAAQALSQAVVLRQDRAELHLHPADLGPVSVSIQVDGNQANLMITAAQPVARDALAAALPQLRHMLAEQGITLGQANVQDDRAGSFATARQQASAARGEPGDRAGTSATVATVSPAARTLRGLVDLFA